MPQIDFELRLCSSAGMHHFRASDWSV